MRRDSRVPREERHETHSARRNNANVTLVPALVLSGLPRRPGPVPSSAGRGALAAVSCSFISASLLSGAGVACARARQLDTPVWLCIERMAAVCSHACESALRGVERRHALAVRAQLRAAMLRRPEPASAGRSHQRAMNTALAEVWARSARLGHLHRRPDGACLDGRASFPAKRIHASTALERREARAACALLSRTRS